jgi:hypothetical protein
MKAGKEYEGTKMAVFRVAAAYECTDVSEVPTASTIRAVSKPRAENRLRDEVASQPWPLVHWSGRVSALTDLFLYLLIYSSPAALMTEAVSTPETSVNLHQPTQRYNQRGGHLRTHCREILR